ncbi:MAG TPA: T9SS type A sorting domain-containing protein [Cytophagaceae bacterium]|nr:T9SS type A sorting domain-containing protein [Cytophagaceae bacterium]
MKQLLLTFFLLSSFAFAKAQTPYVINQNTGKSNGGDDNGMGSSFLTIGAGYLDSIEVIIRTGGHTSGDFYVYSGNTNNVASQIHHEVVSGIPTGAELTYMIKPSANISLSASSTYTFMLFNAPLRFGYTDVYSGGSLWTGAGFLTAGEHSSYDLDFIAYIGPAPVVTAVTAQEAAANNPFIYQDADHNIRLNNFQADEITVSNLEGRRIASGKGDKISVPNFIEGIYIVSARKANQVYTTKIYLKN